MGLLDDIILSVEPIPRLEQKLDAILKGISNLSTDLSALDAKIETLVADGATLTTDVATLTTAVQTMAQEYATVSADIKVLLKNAQGGHPIDYTAELEKVEAAAAASSVSGSTSGVAAVTAEAVKDDQSMNPGSSSNFGEVPAASKPTP